MCGMITVQSAWGTAYMLSAGGTLGEIDSFILVRDTKCLHLQNGVDMLGDNSAFQVFRVAWVSSSVT